MNRTAETTMLLSIEETIADPADSDKLPLNSRLIDPEELRIPEQAGADQFSFSA